MQPQAPRLCVLMSSFNRRDKTLACLASLESAWRRLPVGAWQLQGVLVDDGSTDGTAAAVLAAYPWMRVLRADGQLFWCRGMHRAQQETLAREADLQLWLNDDVLLSPHALGCLYETWLMVSAREEGRCIVLGSTCDARTGQRSYGGERRASFWRRSHFVGQEPGEQALPCETFNGNIVLVPQAVLRRVGDLDPAYEHAMGDTDYGLRASRLGVPILMAPGFLGSCSENSRAGTYHDASLPWARRWQLMLSRKGLPWRSWLRFTRRHMGALWPLYFVWPYLKLLAQRWHAPR